METITATTLSEKLVTLSKKEREVTSEVVLHLSEMDTTKGYLTLGYPSLFVYAREKLFYSEGAAMRRITAARALNDSPFIYEKLRDGSLSLCAISEVAKVKGSSLNKSSLRLPRGSQRGR